MQQVTQSGTVCVRACVCVRVCVCMETCSTEIAGLFVCKDGVMQSH